MSNSGRVIRWVARFFSAIVALIVVIIFIGEVSGAPNLSPPSFSLTELLMSIAFFITWLGLLLGWFRERLGGLMIVFGLLAFYLILYITSGSFPSGLYFFYMLIPGLLYLLSDWMNRSGIELEPGATPDADDAPSDTTSHSTG